MIAGGEKGWRVRSVVSAAELTGVGVFASYAAWKFRSVPVAERRKAWDAMEDASVQKLRTVLSGRGTPEERIGAIEHGHYEQILRQLALWIADELPAGQRPTSIQQIMMYLHQSDPVNLIARLHSELGIEGAQSLSLEYAIDRAETTLSLLDGIKSGQLWETGHQLTTDSTNPFVPSKVIDHSARRRFGDLFSTVFPDYQYVISQQSRVIESADRKVVSGWKGVGLGALLYLDLIIVLTSDDGRGVERFFTD